jgi:uncharacterized SAM-binding protein YcdF (DUF218 family)
MAIFATKMDAPALNNLFALWGLAAWKPLLSALVLPPFPFLLSMLLGARWLRTRRGLGWFLILLSVAGLWLTATEGVARWAQPLLLTKAPVLTKDRLAELKQEAKNTRMAIVVLGSGAEKFAPEYNEANLTGASLERLRYGLWLSRQTGIPVAFTGGSGWAASEGPSEAEVAARIAATDFKQPLKWIEIQSRDTAENAAMTVPVLQGAGVQKLLLVTHGWHMPRAMASFKKFGGTNMTLEAAPMGLARIDEVGPLDWMPSTHGFRRNRQIIHEWLGSLAGA